MSFLYPLGLLGLIGIPILIVIYIIKSKYTEQTVSSTYLWTLSERFLKRRNPISRVTGIISLILQILAIAVISLAIAHPIITVPDAAEEYCFILDGSGSMRTETEEGTRFDAGKQEIAAVIDESVNGSIYSLVYVGDATTVIFERLEDKGQAKTLLSELKPVYVAEDMTDALGVAQGYFNENPAVLTYLVTDKNYEIHNNVRLINVAEETENYALQDVTYARVNGKLVVSGYVKSYGSDATLTLALYADGEQEACATGVSVVKKGALTPFALTCERESFSSVAVEINEKDPLMLDNRAVVHNVESESSYNTLIVSDLPFFLKAAIGTLTDARIDVMSEESYLSAMATERGVSGYGLYVFDAVTPVTMPSDGAVWLVDPQGSLPGEANFSVQDVELLEKGEPLLLTDSTSSAARKLKAGLTGDVISVKRYVKCGLQRNFTTLYSCENYPVVFAGTNAYGNREAVIAFNLHDSNLPLLFDYLVLVRNLVEYSFPDVVEKTSYYCGEEAEINVLSGCDSIRVDSPDGDVTYLNTDNAVSNLLLNEVGVYTVTVTAGDTQRQIRLYASLTEEERIPTVTEAEWSLQGEAVQGGFDGKYDTMTALFILLAVIFLADWVVYCYEKYQLR